jgi:alpha-amylase/alpha-mannosidase (GH57 family)
MDKTVANKNLVIHAHFYQPPRENAWLEAIEVQDSAYPYHDWNERVNAECYAANAYSRILGEKGRISHIVNNYKKISFNFGPTLLIWMKERAPHIHEAIIEADKDSVKERSGHGNALAQAYNHLIMPLATRREKLTQVIWGIEDFRSRFGRNPEGMWLPETAVDTESLSVFAEEGIKFTILAPSQAHRVRQPSRPDWIHADGDKLDFRKPYRVNLPGGKSIIVFFYNGPVSRAVAFEGLLRDGETFAERLVSNFTNENKPQLVHIATDGESYGHHSRFADMALAYCVHYIEEKKLAKVTNYGEFLSTNPPVWEAEIKENTSWSCVHGVERWRANCGCNTGGHPDWNQEWRAPLRESLDWLNQQIAAGYESMGREYFKDPWKARDAYIKIVLDRSPETVWAFFKEHGINEMNEGAVVKALKLLEMERHSMLMFTSCGWFFDELSGIETVQVIQYAGRALQLHHELLGNSLEEEFLKMLEKAKSNIPSQGNGRDIYLRHVKGMMIDLKKVAVHFAISSLFEEYKEKEVLYAYNIDKADYEHHEVGQTELAAGKLSVRSRITWGTESVEFAALKLGNRDINCGLCQCRTPDEYESMKKELREKFLQGSFSETLRIMDKYLGDHTYSLKDLFKDEQRKTIVFSIEGSLQELDRLYRDLYGRNRFLMQMLKDYDVPVPAVFVSTAAYALHSELKRVIQDEFFNAEKAAGIYSDMKEWGIEPNQVELEFILRSKFHELFLNLEKDPSIDYIRHIEGLLKFTAMLPFPVNLWEAQNIYFGMAGKTYPEFLKKASLKKGGEEAREWVQAFKELGDALYFNTEEILRAG